MRLFFKRLDQLHSTYSNLYTIFFIVNYSLIDRDTIVLALNRWLASS